jgi:hypothetical protein
MLISGCFAEVEYTQASGYNEVLTCDVPDPDWIASEQPEFCADYIDDYGYSSGTCCYWYSGPAECYEEWCFWDNACSWEYSKVDCATYANYIY